MPNYAHRACYSLLRRMTHVSCEHVEIRDSRPGLGSGLFASRVFEKGDFLVSYTGKKISSKEADLSKSRYIFELDEEWSIDGETLSNIARYINHACAPNAEAEIQNEEIHIIATRAIEQGEEITIDYGDEYFDEFIRPFGCKCESCQALPMRIPARKTSAPPNTTCTTESQKLSLK